MLSGFQEATQKIQEKDEYALVPFFRFYDTVHTFLDSSIRRVIERCQEAADNGDGIEAQDVNVLKLLYLIRYIDDIPANLDNIVILMADDIRMDKITMRETVRGCLNRLMSQNYIGRTGEVYNFLTDEEQDVQREINNTSVDTAAIVNKISQMIYDDIFTTKKFRHGIYDFDFDKMVDGMIKGSVTGGMCLRFLTIATDNTEKSELRLMTDSKGREAIVVLSDTPYYESLESAMKIRKYAIQRNVNQLPKSVQDIIRAQQEEATKYEQTAKDDLVKAIETAQFYVDGEHIELKGGNAKGKIEEALEYLVSHVYSDLSLIEKNAESDADIIAILTGAENIMPGMEPNRGAAAKIEEYLEMQAMKNLPTSMADIQSRYSAIPYGWKEIDIAAVVARLIYDQKVTIKHAGSTIQPDNSKLPDMLRKKSEIGKTSISKRQMITATKMRAVKELLREYFDVMDVPDDEDGLVAFVVQKFGELKDHYTELKGRYEGHKYPDQSLVAASIEQMDRVLSQRKDNIALIDAILKEEDNLFDNKEKMQRVEGFFKNQVQVFDAAVRMEDDLRNDLHYLSKETEANDALNQIRLITVVENDPKNIYRRIPELNGLMEKVREGHGRLLDSKRAELLEIVRQCMAEVHTLSDGNMDCAELVRKADTYFDQQKKKISELQSLALLDGLVPQIWSYKDDICDRIETVKQPPKPVEKKQSDTPAKPAPKKVIKNVYRQMAFPAKTLESQEDIDAYVERMRSYLTAIMKDCDGITLK